MGDSAQLRQRRKPDAAPLHPVQGVNADDDHPLPPVAAPVAPPSRSSPRYNMFRAARGSAVEEQLLFREQPRQIAVLALVVAAFSYYSFTHDAQVKCGGQLTPMT